MGARELGERLRLGAGLRDLIEDDLPLLVETLDGAIAQHLPDGLLDPRLGQVPGQDGVLVRADHGCLEPHGECELGDHDAQEGQHERHRQQSETALVGGEPSRGRARVASQSSPWPDADVVVPFHCEFTRIGTVIGGACWTRPFVIAVSVTSTARGTIRSTGPSHSSSHAPSSRR